MPSQLRGQPGQTLPLVLVSITALLAATALVLDLGRNALRAGAQEQMRQAAFYVAEAGLEEAVARLWEDAGDGELNDLSGWEYLSDQPVQACLSGETCEILGAFDLQHQYPGVGWTVTVTATGTVKESNYVLRAELTVIDAGVETQRIAISYVNW